MTTIPLDTLLLAGGKLWESGPRRRVYFNNLTGLIGLTVTRFGTGNVSHATLDGEIYANGRATELIDALACAKLWYDLTDNLWRLRGHGATRDHSAEEISQKLFTAVQTRVNQVSVSTKDGQP